MRHYLVFGNEYRTVQKWNDQRILPTFAPSTAAAFLVKSIRAAPITVPELVKLYLRSFEDGAYLVRFHNMNPSKSATVSIPDGWKATEYTLAANQLKSDWKKKQFTWNEEKTAAPAPESSFGDKVEGVLIDIGEEVSGTFKKVVNVFSSEKATQV